jgi:CheY-like chemotaxis protein
MFSTRRSLSLRLIISMGLLSLVASTIMAAVQLHFKYKSNIAAVHESLDQVASGDLKSISASLWQLDTTLLDIQLHGLVARPNFVHATIVQSGKPIAVAGRVDAKRSIRREFDLIFSFNDQSYELGKLVLVASLDGIRDQVGRRSASFDLVLMDIQMPEMDGLEATRIIRSWPKSEGGETPIVAMTAHAFTSDSERFMAAGMNGHLPKPISRQDLERFLRTLPGLRQT